MAATDALNTTTGSPFIPTLVANQVLGRLGAYLNLGRTVAKDSELVTQRVGETINVPKRGAISSNSLAQNGSVTLQQPQATTVPVTLSKHQEVTIAELDYLKSVAQDPEFILPGYVEDGVIALAEDIEGDLAGLWSSVPLQNDAGGSNPQIDIINVRKSMNDNKVPQLADRFGYVSTGFMAKLLQQTPFLTPYLAANQTGMVDGAVMKLSGFQLFEGQKVVRSGSPGVDRNLFYTRNAFVLATRPQPLPDAGTGAVGANVLDSNGIALQVVKSYNATKLANQVTVHVVYGVAMLDDRQAVELDSSY